MAIWVKRYLFTLVILLVLDALWLGVIAPSFYQAQIGFLMAASPNWGAAGVFYVLFVAGLVVFVISPGLEAGAPSRAVWRGALFGLIAYATYDLTNLATLRDWPVLVTVIDLIWGMVLTGGVAAASYLIAGKIV